MKKFLVCVGLVLLLGCIDQSEDVSILPREEMTEVFENNIYAEEISLDFLSHNGFIEVYIWDKPSYRIEINKWARATTSEEAREDVEDFEVDFQEKIENGKITLILKTEERVTAGAEVRAYLPSSFAVVDLSTFNGHIRLEEITASTVSLTTANGDIKASITAENIRIKTSNGKIQGFYHGDQVTIDTTNGRVDIEVGASGDYDIETTNGDIDILVTGDFSFNLRTTAGDIIVEADDVVYTLDERDHKKGYTREDALVSIIASTTISSVTVEKK